MQSSAAINLFQDSHSSYVEELFQTARTAIRELREIASSPPRGARAKFLGTQQMSEAESALYAIEKLANKELEIARCSRGEW